MVETAHPQERAVFGPLDRDQPDPFPFVTLLRPLGDRIGVGAGDRASQTIERPKDQRSGPHRERDRRYGTCATSAEVS
jgi:hypothetical protein